MFYAYLQTVTPIKADIATKTREGMVLVAGLHSSTSHWHVVDLIWKVAVFKQALYCLSHPQRRSTVGASLPIVMDMVLQILNSSPAGFLSAFVMSAVVQSTRYFLSGGVVHELLYLLLQT